VNILLFNQDWFAEEFRAAGHEVYSCGMRKHLDLVLEAPLKPLEEIIDELPGDFSPDVLVIYDESAPIFFGGLEDTDIPAFFYSVDVHHHLEYHKYLPFVVDSMLVAMKDYIPEFKKVGAEVGWMPLWASRYIEPSDEKKYGAVFVGTLDAKLNPVRVDFFRRLEPKVPVMFKTGKYWEIFPYAELVINQTVKADLNFRVFEAMMSGSLLLTEDSPNGLKELFVPDEHLVLYPKNNAVIAAERIKELLADPQRCRRIGKAGRDEILRCHQTKHRAEQILDILTKLEKKAPSSRRYLAQVPNHIWLCRGLRDKDYTHSVRAIHYALRLIDQAIKNNEDLNQELSWHSIRACFEYDRLTRSNHGETMLNRLNEAYPDANLPKIAQVWLCLNRGEIEEATKMVRALSQEDPKIMFQKINSFFGQMLHQVEE
jgi:hypothetical protein